LFTFFKDALSARIAQVICLSTAVWWQGVTVWWLGMVVWQGEMAFVRVRMGFVRVGMGVLRGVLVGSLKPLV